MADEGGGGEGRGRGFKVTDRRGFTADGSLREVEPGPAGAAPPPAEGGSEPGGKVADETAAHEPLPEIDFSTFVMSLSTSAFLHLGEMPHPDTGKPERNLPLAKQTIDILGTLQDKTRGNLLHDEEKLLEHLLYELRLKYVAASR
jgi:hypothetical protein